MTNPQLPRRLRDLLDADIATIQRSQAPLFGIATTDLTRWSRAGHLLRTGDGGYVIRCPVPTGEAPWQTAGREHLLRARAVRDGLPGSYAVGLTAAIAHDLRPLEIPGRVSLSRCPPFRIRRPMIESRQPWGAAEGGVVRTGLGLQVQAVPECVVEVAATNGVRSGLVVANRALATRRMTAEQLQTAGQEFGKRRGSADVRAMVALADERIDRAIETLMFWICHTDGVDVTPQAIIRDRAGEWVAQVDFLVDGTNIVIETDGLEKYRAPADLRREKHRELDIQAAGYIVLRFSWQDMQHPERVRARIHQATQVAAAA